MAWFSYLILYFKEFFIYYLVFALSGLWGEYDVS